jgi:release factor glutamine methyltransferase
MMRTAEVLRRGADYLARHGVDAPRANAEALLETVLGVDRTELLTSSREPDTQQARAYGRALCQRASGTPLQHLTGTQPFRYLSLRVRPGVFVPRPETEVLVDVALDRVADVRAPVVADACTGTGAVALAIKHERHDAAVAATDLAQEAVMLARENARALGLHVEVLQGDLLEPLAGPLDLVTCNPPYIPCAARDDLPREVRADPDLALFGGPEIVARLLGQAWGRVRPGGWVVVEIEESAGRIVGGVAEDAGYRDVEIHPDLTGRPRIVTARRP